MVDRESQVLCFLGVFVGLLACCKGDTPANCTFQDIQGIWTFKVSEGGHDKSIDCSSMGDVVTQTKIKLSFPDDAEDEFGNRGFWTLIYNQGFEVLIHGRKYFAFSKYEGKGENATSICDETLPGWSHDILGHDWACFSGTKHIKRSIINKNYKSKTHQRHQSRSTKGMPYQHNKDFINNINKVQSTWKAGRYPEYDHLTLEDMIQRAGGRKSAYSSPQTAKVSEKTKQIADTLPEDFDWRNVDGINFVSPVRNQKSCGSCYAFASMGMNECRLRIVTNNTVRIQLSPQDVVECSPYSQGCDGGFPYLIGGKYAEDFGLVEEKCNPYTGLDGQCHTDQSCPRHYSFRYRYIGGYYGACNEEEMRIALVKNGPMAVAFEVYSDFFAYKGGIYQHTGLEDKFNPFELTNHAVLLVGYGVDKETGVKFWSVRNSWGESWGEEGYFRILRGVDECAIESVVVESFPIF